MKSIFIMLVIFSANLMIYAQSDTIDELNQLAARIEAGKLEELKSLVVQGNIGIEPKDTIWK